MWGRAPTDPEDIDRPFHFRFRGLHQLHDELERVLIAASKISAKPFAAER
jgi:hypothetical protein